MSQAEELLNSLSEPETTTFALTPDDEPHIIVNLDRSITVPDALKDIAVQFDHDIKTVTFDCPRYWDGRDLYSMNLYINFERPDGVRAPHQVENLRLNEEDESILHFDWTILDEVTMAKGRVTFLVCAKSADSNGVLQRHWNSKPNNDLNILEGMDCVDGVVEHYPDIIEELLANMVTEINLSETDEYNSAYVDGVLQTRHLPEGVPYKMFARETVREDEKMVHVYRGAHDSSNHTGCLQHEISEFPEFKDFVIGDRYIVNISGTADINGEYVEYGEWTFDCTVAKITNGSENLEGGTLALKLITNEGHNFGYIHRKTCYSCGDALGYTTSTLGDSVFGNFGVSIHRIDTTKVTEYEYDVNKIDKDCLFEGYPYTEDKKVLTYNTLTWDGNTEGLVTVDITANGGEPITLYRIFDITLTNEELVRSMFTITTPMGYVEPLTYCDVWDYLVEHGYVTDDVVSLYESFFFVKKDNAEFRHESMGADIVFPKSGFYVPSDITSCTFYMPTLIEQNKTEFHAIDNKYLPKGIPFATEQHSIEFKVDSDEEIILDNFIPFNVGDTVDITVNGIDYSLVAYDSGGVPQIGDVWQMFETDLTVCGWRAYMWHNDLGEPEIWFYSNKDCTISYKGLPVPNKLDVGYLPDGYPHIRHVNVLEIGDKYEFVYENDTDEVARCNLPSHNFRVGETYKVNIYDLWYTCVAKKCGYGVGFGNLSLVDKVKNKPECYTGGGDWSDLRAIDTGEPFCVVFSDYYDPRLHLYMVHDGYANLSIYSIGEEVVPMDPKFLPDYAEGQVF